VVHDLLIRKHCFLYELSEKGFRSIIVSVFPPTIWPHALAKVSMYPSYDIPLLATDSWEFEFWSPNRLILH
jgi:hypothetical protein